MPVNNFKAFSAGVGANVITQSAYEALTTLIANGFQTGTASSQNINKVFRQTSIMSAVLGQYIVELTGQDALDDGTTATLLTNLKSAIANAAVSATGAAYKLPCRAATTANIAALSGGTPNTLDGITLVAADRVLVKNQTTASENGIYVVTTLGSGSNGTWTRATDADGAGELIAGAVFSVVEGSANSYSFWMLTITGAVTIGTTALTFTRKDAGAAQGVAPGVVSHFAANTAPSGWLKANGAAVSRTTYATLFAVVGTAYGAGDGSTTFNLPDLRGEFLRGWDDGRGVDSGRTIASNQAGDNASHSHTVTDPGHAHSYSGPTGTGYGQPGGGAQATTTLSTASATTGITLASSGSEARPRNVALLACIKY